MPAQRTARRLHHCECAQCQQHPYSAVAEEHQAINRVLVSLDEKNRRRFAGLLAMEFGSRSISLVSAITGLSRITIRRGRREIERPTTRARTTRIRVRGGGRPMVEKNSPASYRLWKRCWRMTPLAIRSPVLNGRARPFANLRLS